MKISRRLFLRAVPAAPLAAQQAAAATVRQSFFAGELLGGVASLGAGPVGGPAQSADLSPWAQAEKAIMDELRKGKIPPWRRRQFLAKARLRAGVLDDDLMAMRSWSDGAKRRVQVRREIARLLDEEIAYDEAQRGFQSLLDRFRGLFGKIGG